MIKSNNNLFLYQIKYLYMLLTNQISNIIDSQRHAFMEKDTGLTREIINKIPVIKNFATIITGIRRCGKSTLMHQLMKDIKDEFVYMNFEDTRLINFEPSDYNRLSEIIKTNKCNFLFFDEIQLANKWEVFIRHKLDEGYKIVLTGSNAAMLSMEIGTSLTGRHLSVELFPFSYNEFLNYKNLSPSADSLKLYLVTGGFPEYLKTNDGSILNQLMNDILVRDIAVRYGVRDVSALKHLALYLVSNIGRPVSGNSLTKMFGIKANSTLLEYMSYLENSYLFYFLPMFSYSLKVQIRNPRKVYCVDNGLITENSVLFSEDNGQRLENLVFTYLRRKYKQLYYFKGDNECDFVCQGNKSETYLLQVCYELNDLNFSRELKGLTEAMDFFKIKNGTIVTINQQDQLSEKGKKISIVKAHDYFLRNNLHSTSQ